MSRTDTVTGVHGAGGLERRYRLVVPEAAGRPAGLVVMLHGCTQDAADLAAGTGMDGAAASEGWAVLYPEQDPAAHPQTCWRWFEADQREAGSGEAALIADLAAEVAAERLAGDAPVWIGGISAGAAMALNVFALRPGLFDGVGLHSGVPYGAADNQQEGLAAMAGGGPGAEALARRLHAAVLEADASSGTGRLPPLILFHGTDDEAVDPANARRIAAAWHGAASLLAGDAEAAAGHPGEAEAPREPVPPPGLPDPADRERGEEGRPFERLRWPAAPGRGPMEAWRVEGLGHAWSGGRPEGSYADPDGPSATGALVRFFRRTADASSNEGPGSP